LGPPGIGKTLFSETIAKFLGTDFYCVRFETVQISAELAGTSTHWSNAHPGEVFRALLNGRNANPVFLLDELDKAAHREEYGDVRAALYSLFEPVTSSEFVDKSLPMLKFNCSHIVWFAAANEATPIP